MKQFAINNKCTSCGLCLTATDLIRKNRFGLSEVVKGSSIEEHFIKQAADIMENCPANAISIISKQQAKSLDELAANFEQRLNQIPECSVTVKYIIFDANMYYIHYNQPLAAAGFPKYKTPGQARKAALIDFEQMSYSKRDVIIANLYSSYKKRQLKPFYDLSNNGYYAQQNQLFANVLEEVAIEAKALAGNRIALDDSFTEFAVKPANHLISYLEGFEIEVNSYAIPAINKYMQERNMDSSNFYKHLIEIEDREMLMDRTDYRGNLKLGKRYVYTLSCAYDMTKKFIKQLIVAMNYLDIDKAALKLVVPCIESYNENVAALKEQKIIEFRAAIANI